MTATASKTVKAIREGVKVLTLQPGIGRPAEDMTPECREWLIDIGHSGCVTCTVWKVIR
jgi:hypothetical protein